MSTAVLSFLIGFGVGIALMIYVSSVKSKHYKEEKEKIELAHTAALQAAEKQRNEALIALEAKRKEIENLTIDQAKAKLDAETQAKIESSTASASNEAVAAIMQRVQGAAK